jgi:hypothetical protein
MKQIFFLVSLIFTTAIFAKGEQDEKKNEIMKAMKDYSTPGASHKVLEQTVGNWKYNSKFWQTADGKPEESKGTSTLKMIMGGRFLQHETHGKAMGMPFSGLGFTGYNNLKGEYETMWIDNMGTGMMHGTGSFDAKTNTLSDSGEYSCPLSKDKTRKYRTEWKIIDKNNMTYTMWGPDESGAEMKQMELTFKRSAS